MTPRAAIGTLAPAPAGLGGVEAPPSWLGALRAGDPGAERTFYETHVGWVYQLALRVTREPELACDLTQETFIRAFARLAQFRGEAPIGAWLRQVALSVILNGLTRVTRRRQWEVPWADSGLEVLAVVDPAAERVPQDEAVRARLAAALAALAPTLRGVVLLHDVEGYSHAEIAAALGISVAASKVRLLRGRTRLRALLADVWATWQRRPVPPGTLPDQRGTDHATTSRAVSASLCRTG